MTTGRPLPDRESCGHDRPDQHAGRVCAMRSGMEAVFG